MARPAENGIVSRLHAVVGGGEPHADHDPQVQERGDDGGHHGDHGEDVAALVDGGLDHAELGDEAGGERHAGLGEQEHGERERQRRLARRSAP